MTVPTTSAGSRSGVNWMRENCACTASHTLLTVSVLARPGHALEQHVAAGEQADQDALDHVALADDDLAHLVQDGVDEGALALRPAR